MRKLSIGKAWDESSAFVRRDFGRLFLISFGLLALPAVIFQAFIPQVPPGQQPQAGAWMLMILPAIVLNMLGTLTLAALALSSAQHPGDAFAHALRRLLPVLGAALLFGFAVFLCAFPVSLLAALLAGGNAEQPTAAMLPLMLILFAIFLFLWVRMMLMSPVAVAEEGGPVAILKRSWALTRGHFWRLFGFALLFVITFVILTLAVTFVGGSIIILVAGHPQDSGLARVLLGLLGGLLNAGLLLYFTILIARIYAQLRGGETSGT